MSKPIPLYRWFARIVAQHAYYLESGNTTWADITESYIKVEIENAFPSGGGFECGTKFDLEAAAAEITTDAGRILPLRRLQFSVEYHHLDDLGYYDGWTQHVVTVRPDLETGFDISVSGRDRNEIKDLIAEIFSELLCREVTEHAPTDAPSSEYEFRVGGARLCSADFTQA